MFGEEGLKNGIPMSSDDSKAWTSGYVFHGNAEMVFRDFFGGDNPFQGLLNAWCVITILTSHQWDNQQTEGQTVRITDRHHSHPKT